MGKEGWFTFDRFVRSVVGIGQQDGEQRVGLPLVGWCSWYQRARRGTEGWFTFDRLVRRDVDNVRQQGGEQAVGLPLVYW